MRKVELDQYFTREEDALHFVELLNKRYPMSSFDMILEPSAGAGAFYKHLPSSNRLGLDICPLHDDIQTIDFFQWNHPGGRTAVIGNPPFGRRGSLAKKFFQKCTAFAEVIAFIFPAIFSKPSFYKGFNKHFHLEYEEPVNTFYLPDGTEHGVNCVFQIWTKRSTPRVDEDLEDSHRDFKMIHRHVSWTSQEELDAIAREYEFAFGQVSHRINNIATLRKGSQFFIKDVSQHGCVRQLFELMDFSHLKKYSAGAISLSRNDVVKEYAKQLSNKKLLVSSKETT